MFKTLTKAALASIAAIAFAGAAQAVSITNGDFEAGAYVGGPDGFQTVASGNTAITGWTVGGAGVDWVGTYWQQLPGSSKSVDLHQLNVGSIEQMITGLTPGLTYLISFYVAPNSARNQLDKSATLAFGADSVQVTYDTTAANTLNNMGWEQRTYSFVASTTDQLLKLTGSVAPGDDAATGLAVDNFSISAAPDAATWLSMIVGFGAAGTVLRRQRGKLATA